jgi:hypothetical protein
MTREEFLVIVNSKYDKLESAEVSTNMDRKTAGCIS